VPDPRLGPAAEHGALVPRQIQFTNDARVLVVDEGGSSTIDTFVVGRNDTPGPAITTPSTGSGLCGCERIIWSRPSRHSACAAAGSACSRTRAYRAAVWRRQSASCNAATGFMTGRERC
jgi:hypothetical protein